MFGLVDGVIDFPDDGDRNNQKPIVAVAMVGGYLCIEFSYKQKFCKDYESTGCYLDGGCRLDVVGVSDQGAFDYA